VATRWVIEPNAWMEIWEHAGACHSKAQSLFDQIDAQTASEFIDPKWVLYKTTWLSVARPILMADSCSNFQLWIGVECWGCTRMIVITLTRWQIS
jgi:hypothetical protein